MKKSRIQFLYAILAFLAAEAMQYTVVIIYELIYVIMITIKLGIRNGSEELGDLQTFTDRIIENMSMDILYLISVVAVLICGIGFYFWYRHEIKFEIRRSLRKVFTVKTVVLFVLLGAGCQFFISGIMSIAQDYFTALFEDYAKQLDMLTGGNFLVVLCLMIFVAPITEELIFRGVILHKASRAIPFWGANLLQAMLFGVYHMNIVQGIYAAFIGIILGLVYHKFRTIYATMLLHMLINASSFLLVLFPESNWSHNLLLSMGGLATFAALYLLFISKAFIPKEKPEISDVTEAYNENSEHN